MPRVVPIKLLMSNLFVVQQQRTVIIDAGSPGNGRSILRILERHGIGPDEVSLILLTHGHVDHFGSALELKRATGAPIAIHAADAHALRLGHNPPLQPTCLFARLLQPYLNWTQHTEPFEPDLLIDENTRLDVFGVSGRILLTPGHTAGSISVLLSNGELVAGDLLMGGMLGGYLSERNPGLTYFIDDLAQNLASIASVLELPLTTIHVGHGGPLDPERVRKCFGTPAACAPR